MQDSTRLISWVSMNPNGKEAAWSFVKASWPLIVERYGEGGFYLSSLIETVVGRLGTQKDRDDAAAFFQANPIPTASDAVSNALGFVDANIAWAEHSLPLISYWLSTNSL